MTTVAQLFESAEHPFEFAVFSQSFNITFLLGLGGENIPFYAMWSSYIRTVSSGSRRDGCSGVIEFLTILMPIRLGRVNVSIVRPVSQLSREIHIMRHCLTVLSIPSAFRDSYGLQTISCPKRNLCVHRIGVDSSHQYHHPFDTLCPSYR